MVGATPAPEASDSAKKVKMVTSLSLISMCFLVGLPGILLANQSCRKYLNLGNGHDGSHSGWGFRLVADPLFDNCTRSG